MINESLFGSVNPFGQLRVSLSSAGNGYLYAQGKADAEISANEFQVRENFKFQTGMPHKLFLP